MKTGFSVMGLFLMLLILMKVTMIVSAPVSESESSASATEALALKWYDCSVGGCPVNPCGGKVYSMRDAHNCKVKSAGKHYGCPKTVKCYKIKTAMSYGMKGGFCCS